MRTITRRTLKTLQVLPNRMCTRISFFVSKTVREIRAFFLSTTKYSWNESTTSSADGRLTRHGQGVSARPPAALREDLIQHGLDEKKKRQANFVNSRKLLLKVYKFKKSKCDRFGKRPAATAAEKIDEWSTEADVSAFRRSIGLFFFVCFFLRSSKNFRFAFPALNVSSQAFTWKISICSAKSNHVLRCSLSGELATGRARLLTRDRVAASQLQLTLVNRKSSAFSSAGLVGRLESRSWKVRLGQQSYSICNRAREIEFNFFTAWTIFMKLGTLVHHLHGYKQLPQMF